MVNTIELAGEESFLKISVTDKTWCFETNGDHVCVALTEMDDPRFILRTAERLHVEPKKILSGILRCQSESLRKPLSLQELADILSTTVKKDEASKLISFGAALLAQTSEDQINIAFQAESSSGKSYIPLEICGYFPVEEVLIYGYVSPTAFFYGAAGREWDKESKVWRVDLERKIMIFLDQPHWKLMERLRPILSHDQKEITHSSTDKAEKRGLKANPVIIRGFPTVFFCTTKPALGDQEKTRLWLLSPEVSSEKIREVLHLLAQKHGNTRDFRKWVDSHPKRIWLKERIRLIRKTGIRNIIIPNTSKLAERFIKTHRYSAPRQLRDLPRLISLIKFHALLNVFNRERIDEETILAKEEDIEAGFRLYSMTAESNELGLSPEIYRIFKEVIQPICKDIGVTRREILIQYHRVYHRPLNPRRLRDEILPALEAAGLIRQESNPNDQRERLVFITEPDHTCEINRHENGVAIFSKDRNKKTPHTLSDISETRITELIE